MQRRNSSPSKIYITQADRTGPFKLRLNSESDMDNETNVSCDRSTRCSTADGSAHEEAFLTSVPVSNKLTKPKKYTIEEIDRLMAKLNAANSNYDQIAKRYERCITTIEKTSKVYDFSEQRASRH